MFSKQRFELWDTSKNFIYLKNRNKYEGKMEGLCYSPHVLFAIVQAALLYILTKIH